MIVLDENLSDPIIKSRIKRWAKGTVFVISERHPHMHVQDEEIPRLLRELKQPTFVTTNYTDFWRKVERSRDYCVVCIKLSIERSPEVPDILRSILSLPDFRTKRQRMGKVISYSDGRLDWYE